ncbi:tRNA (adenosine(37)-N6)-threonylcarbamoyltransferase complex dimerization subunit type 1 TsaB [uncultured Sphingomonas sp.]|uniref:tRNA (adenosine(37)-N6)-threonylcarbamoyltransferase complex dimerization subunit type 1 TsaB n=1 Tax=uncultured Sphingomonas sp. TaxID=158754 RepID=UPI0025F2D440|nr:tRNA (adenosine(37)-N6)-threonylcarbamoyltransferase complex dimerization subunit type 1 TsaB [uncultured Sphingomonas sp.]
MKRLVIETATAACSAALLDGDRVLAARHEVVGRGHAERLVPMLGEILAEAGVARAETILVDCGPGSFTGIRVGLAAARALGLAWGVPVHGYSALALIAAQAGGEESIGVAMTGGHGEVFVQRFAPRPLSPVSALASLPPAKAAQAVPDGTVLGSGAAALVAARGHGEAQESLPEAAQAWRLPAALAALPPSPLYGRAPDAALPK